MANPIWKDYYVNLGTAESIYFRILVDGVVIYTGRAFKRPGQTYNEICINDICADYVKSSLTASDKKTFAIQTSSTGAAWSAKASVEFENNWSYDPNYNSSNGKSAPINYVVDNRQILRYTPYGSSASLSVKFVKNDGTYYYEDVSVPSDGTIKINLATRSGLKSIVIESREFKVVNSCNRYVLYYVNAYGGWDSLLIEGNHAEADTLTRHSREVGYNNGNILSRGLQNYVNEIVKTFTLHTSWLSDDEASRMHHLLNSTDVYLRDFVTMNTQDMIPVVVTDTTTEYKTYKGNGGRLVNYAINVRIAKEMTRR